MVIYIDIIILEGNYIVVNELKVHMNNNHFKVFFHVHVKEIMIETHPKMIMTWTMKIWLILVHSKIHNFFFVNFFLTIVFAHMFFLF